MSSFSWGQSYWNMKYGGMGWSYPTQVMSLKDNSALILGGNNSGIWLLKINAFGDTLWTKTYHGNATQMLLKPDGSLLILGTLGYQNIQLLKIDSLGDTLWGKTYSGNFNDYPTQMVLQPDGTILVLGSLISNESKTARIWLLKLNSFGDTLWTRTYGVSNDDEPTQMLLQSDGSILILGSTESTGAFTKDIQLIKINSSGRTLWRKTYGGQSNDNPTQMALQSDGSMLILGNTSSYGAGGWDIWLLKINSSGDTLWTKTYGGTQDDNPTQMILQPDGAIYILGITDSYGAGGWDNWLLKINSSGDMLWTKTYGGAQDDCPKSIIKTSDDNFLIAGIKAPIDSNILYFLKIKPNGDTLWMKSFQGYYFAVAIPTSNENFNAIELFGPDTIYFLTFINNQHSYNNSLYTFKIPVIGDTLYYAYFPIKVPSGMTVSLGGTISWTPKTDSIYMDYAEFLVADDHGRRDTLLFNIFVNSNNVATSIKSLPQCAVNKSKNFSISQTSNSQIKFNFPSRTSAIDIYDINGRCVQRLKTVDVQVVWNGLNSAGRPVSSGRYFVKIKDGSSSRMAEFSVVR
jgi:hypothetical protein